MILRLLVGASFTLLIITDNETQGAEDVLAVTSSPTSVNVASTEPLLDYVGCYEDEEDPNRKLNGLYVYNYQDQMTPKMCIAFCKINSYVFAGIQEWSQCYCGNQTPLVSDKRQETECSLECPGDSGSKCGGHWRNSIYRTGAGPLLDYVGCYADEGDPNRKLNGLYAYNYQNQMTPKMCIAFCKVNSYVFAGIQAWSHCYCGNQTPLVSDKRQETDCRLECPGDSGSKCGGHWRNSIYRTGAVDKTDTTVECQMSATTVNNQFVCANTVVFEEHFDTISQVKWKRLVQIPSHPEYQFVIYNSTPDNSFTTNGKLVIKPLFLTDSQVKYGNLELPECTGERFTSECGYKAQSYSILPPVQTASLTTHNSFAFRYGKLEMTAKLPMGDWLVPELWLEPKNNVYGPAYASSRIQLAMSRGNRNLKIDGQEIGCKQLESGVLVSYGDDIRNRTIIRKTQDCWHNSYHNYSLVWTPDNIIFTIDGGMPQVLIPNDDDTLSDVIGLSPGIKHPWNSTVRTAPFDQEFYIVVGLSAGGMKEFPDNSVNSGRPKPWRNFEAKAMLNFWKDRNYWKTTWQENTALLQIDYIKVTAL